MIIRKVLLLPVISMTFLHSMNIDRPLQSGMESLTQDIVHGRIQPLLFLEDIGRLKQVSSGCNVLYDAEKICPFVGQSNYFVHACSRLEKNYYACTKALAHFAGKKNKKTRNDDEKRFQYLWQYHKDVRNANTAKILKFPTFTVQDQMRVYKKYSNKKKICTHILGDGVQWLSSDNADNARIMFSCGNLHIDDLLRVKYTRNNSLKLYAHLEYIFYHACGLNDAYLIQTICGESVATWLFEYIMRYATSSLIIDLIRKGIMPINGIDALGKSLLHYVAEFGFDNVIKIVLKDAYINCIDNEGMTPLHHATKNLHRNIVKILLADEKVNVCFVDKHGKTAFDYVKKHVLDNPVIKKQKNEVRILLRPYIETARINNQLVKMNLGYQKLQ